MNPNQWAEDLRAGDYLLGKLPNYKSPVKTTDVKNFLELHGMRTTELISKVADYVPGLLFDHYI